MMEGVDEDPDKRRTTLGVLLWIVATLVMPSWIGTGMQPLSLVPRPGEWSALTVCLLASWYGARLACREGSVQGCLLALLAPPLLLLCVFIGCTT